MGKLSYPSTVGYLRNGRWKENNAETTANVATVMAPARRSWIGRCTALPTGYYVDGCGSFGWRTRRGRARRGRAHSWGRGAIAACYCLGHDIVRFRFAPVVPC